MGGLLLGEAFPVDGRRGRAGNKAAIAGAAKAYPSAADLASIVAAMHARWAELEIDPWVEFVKSAADLVDEPSRGGRSDGWFWTWFGFGLWFRPVGTVRRVAPRFWLGTLFRVVWWSCPRPWFLVLFVWGVCLLFKHSDLLSTVLGAKDSFPFAATLWTYTIESSGTAKH